MTISTFQQVILSGVDVKKFLQGQVTVNLNNIEMSEKNSNAINNDTDINNSSDNNNISEWQATAICSLKGRIQFGIWITSQKIESFSIVIHHSCMAEFIAHVKKFGAFSKFSISEPTNMYTCVNDGLPSFTSDSSQNDEQEWQKRSIALGNYWITSESQLIFQPQELRLHQRGGVNYDKGCYLGQEVIARIYFRSAPRAYLHLVSINNDTCDEPLELPKIATKIGENNKVQVVNAITTDSGVEALVIARDNHLDGFHQLALPPALQEDVARKLATDSTLK